MRWGRVPGSWSVVVMALTAAGHASAEPRNEEAPSPGPDAEQVPAQSTNAGQTAPQILVRPQPLSTPVEYPFGATGSHSVLLELVIGVDGTVTSLDVLEGEEPFVSAARSSSGEWVFVPARRGEAAVPARVRFTVRFEQREVQPEDAPQPEERTGLGATADAPTEIVVTGEAPIGAQQITSAEARMMPGAFGDPLRAMETLPGVSNIVSGLPIFYVRGAPPGNVAFYVDGIQVPFLFHNFLLYSTLHPEVIDHVDVHKGPYPARLGRSAGGVVEIVTQEPEEDFSGTAQLSLFDLRAAASSGFADGRGRASVSGAYSLTQGTVFSALLPVELFYWDYQARVSYDLTPKDTIGVFAFGSYDFINDDEPTEGALPPGIEYHRVDLRYGHKFSAQSKGKVAVTFGADNSQLPNGSSQDIVIGGRAELESQLEENLGMTVGVDGKTDDYALDIDPDASNYDEFMRLFPSRRDFVVGAYAQLAWRPDPRVEVGPGVRADVYGSAGEIEVGVDPRLQARFRLAPTVHTLHGVGLSHQTPNFVPGVPGIQVAGFPNGLQRTVHTSHGVEWDITNDMKSGMNLFLNSYFNLTDPIGLTQNFVPDADIAQVPLQGASVGAEFFFQKKLTQHLGGQLSYALTRSTRSHATIDTLSGYDRTHVLNAALVARFFESLQLSTKAVVYSGVPGSRIDQSPESGPAKRVFDQERARPFFRLDVKVEYRKPLFRNGYWSVFAEALNTTFSAEVVRRTCTTNGCQDDVVGPIFLPNVGAEIAY